MPHRGSVQPEQILAGRYRLIALIGQGTFGRVWRAWDDVARHEVAVKVVPAPDEGARRAQRMEAASLRQARLPGVVLLSDDGVEGGDAFLVMPLLADAVPFPSTATPWPELQEVATRLLEVLARVHHAGLVHRDLKPGNVLIDAQGRVRLLDFGLALHTARPTGPATIAGTPAYAAPEQRRWGEWSPAADLWSVGAMLYAALAGRHHLDGIDALDLLGRTHGRTPRPLRELAPDVPEHVAEVVHALLADEPEDRPASAEEALQALGGAPPLVAHHLSPPLGERATDAELRALFHGPDLFLHLKTDGAQALRRRTDGRWELVIDELDAWIRAGIAHWDDDAVRITRDGLSRLDAGLRLRVRAPSPVERDLHPDDKTTLDAIRAAWPSAHRAWIAAAVDRPQADADASVARLIAAGLAWQGPGDRIDAEPLVSSELGDLPPAVIRARLHAAGLPVDLTRALEEVPVVELLPRLTEAIADAVEARRADDALSLAEVAVIKARHQEDGASEADLLVQVACALAQMPATDLVRRALRIVGEREANDPTTTACDDLLHAGAAFGVGDMARALALLDRCAGVDDPRLVLAVTGARIQALSRDRPAEALTLAEAAASRTAGLPALEARRLNWLGNLYYALGDYPRAAESHLASTRVSATPRARLSGTLNAAAALLESSAFDAARQEAERAGVLARSCRAAGDEAAAAWMVRSASYRAGRTLALEPEVGDAAEQVSPYLGALHALVDAAIAWRAKDPAALELAQRVRRSIGAKHHAHMVALAAALCVAAGDHGDDLLTEATSVEGLDARATIQLSGLLAQAGKLSDGMRERALAAFSQLPPDVSDARWEVLSASEALALLTPPPETPHDR